MHWSKPVWGIEFQRNFIFFKDLSVKYATWLTQVCFLLILLDPWIGLLGKEDLKPRHIPATVLCLLLSLRPSPHPRNLCNWRLMRQVLPSSKFIHSGVGGNDLVEDFAEKLRTFLKKIKIKFKISFVVEIDILIQTKEKRCSDW